MTPQVTSSRPIARQVRWPRGQPIRELSRADGVRPERLGPGDADRRRRDPRGRALRLSRSARSSASSGAWAKLSDSIGRAALADAYTTVLRGIPDLLVIYLFYFGGSVGAEPDRRLVRRRAASAAPGLRDRRARGRPRVRRLPDRSVPRRLPRARTAARSRRRARSACIAGCCSGASSRRRCCAMRFPGLGNVWQLVLKESALISVTGLVELLRQSQSAPARRASPSLSTSPRPRSISRSRPFRPGASSGRRLTRSRGMRRA